MTFKYDKDNLFKEFEIAKQKDIQLSKAKTQDEKENDYFSNRIQFFKDHIELKKSNPDYYEFLNIKFDNMLSAYETESPRDTFYTKVFGKSYFEKRNEDEPKASDF